MSAYTAFSIEQLQKWDAFRSFLSDNPGDFTGYLALADWLSENSLEPSFEYALRWAAKRNKHPRFDKAFASFPWRWYRGNSQVYSGMPKTAPHWPATLTAVVFAACAPTVTSGQAPRFKFRTWLSAMTWLAGGLAVLRREIEV